MAYHEKFGQYDLGAGHSFRGDRFVNAIHFFEEQGLFRLPHVTMLTPKPVTKQDLLKVHDEKYVNLIYRLAETSKSYDIQTPVSPQILEATQLIVGGAMEAGSVGYKSEVSRGVAFGCGFHHARGNYGGGFCLFNDIVVLE